MAVTKVGSLVVDLIAESAKYVEELKKANQQTIKFAKDVGRSMDNLAGNIAGLAAGYLGLSAIIAQTNRAMADAKEIENMSRLAGQSVEDFQAAAYATEQYGIRMDKLGDISKDVSDKLGDFTATGGGEFQDFFEEVAPKVGLTADELQHLSGPEVLLAVKQAMDDANVPMKEQIFYLESIANDASLLIPLLEDSGLKYNELTAEARNLNIVLSEQDISNLSAMNTELTKVSRTLQSSFATAVVGASNQIQWLTEVIADAVVYWGAFFDSFRDEPKTIEGLNNKLVDLNEELESLNTQIDQPASYWQGDDAIQMTEQQTEAIRDALRKRRDVIEAEIQAIQQLKNQTMGVPSGPRQPSLPDIPELTPVGTGTSRTGTVDKDAQTIIDANQRILDNLTQQLATEAELVEMTYQQRVNEINNLVLTKAQVEAAGYDNLLQLQADYLLQAEAARQESLEKIKQDTENATNDMASQFDKLANAINANTSTIEQAANSWANSFSTEMANMVTTGEMDFGRLAESIINDLIRIAIQANITNAILDAMGMGGGNSGGGDAPDAKATGGPVMSGSTYQNVAPKVGLTSDELMKMSGPGVLLAVQKAMEDANVPMKEQIFYLESIANDASLLIPILENNGRALGELEGRYRDMNVALSETDISTLRDMEKAFKDAKREAESLSDTIWVSLSGAMTELANASADFFAAFRKNIEEFPVQSLEFQIDSLSKQLYKSEGLAENYYNTITTGAEEGASANQKMGAAMAQVRYDQEIDKQRRLVAQINELQAELDSLNNAPPTTHTIDITYSGDSPKQKVDEDIAYMSGAMTELANASADFFAAFRKNIEEFPVQSLEFQIDSLSKQLYKSEGLAENYYNTITTGAEEGASANQKMGAAMAQVRYDQEIDKQRRLVAQINELQAELDSLNNAPPTTPYLVGEKGPELFTASNSGNIIPNNQMGGNTTVNVYTQPGETAETRTRSTPQGDIVEVFMKQIDSRMNEQISRGQGLARTLEGRYSLTRKAY